MVLFLFGILSIYYISTVCGISLSTGPLNIQIDNTTTNIDYTISFNNNIWLISGSTFIHNNQTIYSSKDSSLKLKSTSLNKGNDNNLGSFTSFEVIWQYLTTNNKLNEFSTSIIVYNNLLGVIIFEQKFLSSISNTAQSSPWSTKSKCIPPVGGHCEGFNNVNSGFPTFNINKGIFKDPIANGMRYIYWNGIQGHYAHTGNQISQFSGSYLGGTPLVLFNEAKNLNNASKNIMVISSLNHFKTSTISITDGTELCVGIGGLTDSIDINTIHRSIIYAAVGVNDSNIQISCIADVLFEFGDVMLRYNGRQRKSLQESKDISISHLGYWADNGAYYCLISEANKSYEQTMIDVANYFDSSDVLIPVNYFQLDWSWYYPQCFAGPQICAGWSVNNWTADTFDSWMYPNGLSYLYKQLNYRGFDLHNRQWHPVNYYTINNEFEFIIEGEWINTTDVQSVGLPVDNDAFFYSLFTNRTNDGLWIYEKDYLYQQFVGQFMSFSNLTYYESYLQSMNNAAIKVCDGSNITKCGNNGLITIQYCTASPNDILASINLDRVTQVRVSTDYMAGSQQPGGDWNWHIAGVSLLASAVGLAPFKDNFWSTQYQTGNPWNVNEPNSVLNALISSLSNGPIGFGDKINNSNRSIIIATCRDDGLLLKSDRSILPIDRTFSSNSYTNSTKIWYSHSTFTVNNQNFTWFYVLIADVYDSDYYLTFNDLGPLAFRNNPNKNYLLTPLNITYNKGIYNEYNSGSYLWNNSLPVLKLDKMENTTKIYKQGFVPQFVPYQYYILSPQFTISNDWYLIGEYTKYITMSFQRFKTDNSITINGSTLTLMVEGVMGETIFTKAYYKPSSAIFTKSCIVSNNNLCQIVFSGNGSF